MFSVYQRGRGHEPVTVAGSIRSFVAVSIESASSSRSGGPSILDLRSALRSGASAQRVAGRPPLGAAGGNLVGAGPAGEADQVLVELEPDAVVAVDAG